jgi:hypothetical protein
MKITETYEETRIQDEPKLCYLCDGCSKLNMADEGRCSVYAYVPHLFRTYNECPFNQRKKTAEKKKIRVGQGKTKAGGNR